MADSKTVTIVPLIGSKYPTWKIQCQMALMKAELWGIVNGTEIAPGETHADSQVKFVSKECSLHLKTNLLAKVFF